MTFLRFIGKNLFIFFFVLLFLACQRNVNNQNMPATQETEKVVGNTIEQNYPLQTDVVELQTAVIEPVQIPDMILIPSVEPEQLRNIMPNSWHKLTKLSEDEEQTFIRENTALLMQIAEALRRYYQQWLLWSETREISCYFMIFRQQVGVDIFYRIFASANSSPDFMCRAVSFGQYLVHQNVLLLGIGYANRIATQFGDIVGPFTSIDIVTGSAGAKGVLLTRLGVELFYPLRATVFEEERMFLLPLPEHQFELGQEPSLTSNPEPPPLFFPGGNGGAPGAHF